jgi:hypothetical protein
MSRLSLFVILVLGVAGAGCASTRRPSTVESAAVHCPAGGDDEQAVPASAVTAALVFRAPVAMNDPPLDLDRGLRQPSAFIGYEEPITEYYHVLTIDRQGSGCGFPFGGFGGFGWAGSYGDRYEREAVIEKVGALHR